MPEMFDDLESDVAAAVRGAPAEPAAPAPEAAPAPAAVADQAATDAAAEQAKIDAAGRAHGKDGKFVPKPGEKEPEATTAPASAKADAKQADAPLMPPSHWDAQAKAEFMNAPRAVQQQILKREEEITGKSKEWQGKAEDYNRLDKVIAPHRDRLAREGRDPAMAINQLFSFENAMQTNPVNGVVEILKVFARGNELGVINAIAQANGLQLVKANNQGQPEQGADPTNPADPTARRLQELQEQVQNLTRTATQQQQTEQQQREQQAAAHRQSVLSEVAAFAKDPAHLYYENVKLQMSALLKIGDEAGDARPIQERLKEAYDQAVHANPQTRAIILAEQQRKQQAEEQARAEAARRAAVSVTGSPGPGAAQLRPSGANSNSIEDDVRAAFAASRA